RIHWGGDQVSGRRQRGRAGAPTGGGVTSRSAALPGVASTRELGFPNLDLRGWNGFFAPARTPEPVIARLHQEIAAAAKHPDVQRRFAEVGAEPVGSTPAEMHEIVRDQMDKVRPLGADVKLTVQSLYRAVVTQSCERVWLTLPSTSLSSAPVPAATSPPSARRSSASRRQSSSATTSAASASTGAAFRPRRCCDRRKFSTICSTRRIMD